MERRFSSRNVDSGAVTRSQRDLEPERRAATDVGDDADGASHELDYALAERQAEASAEALLLLASPNLYERLEEQSDLVARDPRSVVCDFDRQKGVFGPRAAGPWLGAMRDGSVTVVQSCFGASAAWRRRMTTLSCGGIALSDPMDDDCVSPDCAQLNFYLGVGRRELDSISEN